MSDSTEPSLAHLLAAHFTAALEEVILAIRDELAAGRKPRGDRREPSISYGDNGMPRLSDGSNWEERGPLQYADLLEREVDPERPFNKIKFERGRFSQVDALSDFIQENPSCAKTYNIEPQLKEESAFDLTRVVVEFQLQHAVNRFFQRFGNVSFDDHRRTLLLAPIFRGMFNERVRVTNVIPIALVKFDFSRMRLAPDAYIIRMSEGLQKKRWSVKAYGSSGHDGVVSAATHAFVITGWNWPNLPWLQMSSNLTAHTPALREKIEELFAALRLVTGASTGYAQELRLARGWTHLHVDQSPEVYAAGARRYSEEFDNFGWTRDDIATISREQMGEIATALRQIRSINDDRLSLASRRMNGAMIRSEAADAILDATIALEILLGDGDSQAVGYKLRIRAAALANFDEPGTGVEIGAAIKQIYEARSRIVHGALRKRQSGKARLDQDDCDLAVKTLRRILRIVIKHSKYLNPKRIDADLLFV